MLYGCWYLEEVNLDTEKWTVKMNDQGLGFSAERYSEEEWYVGDSRKCYDDFSKWPNSTDGDIVPYRCEASKAVYSESQESLTFYYDHLDHSNEGVEFGVKSYTGYDAFGGSFNQPKHRVPGDKIAIAHVVEEMIDDDDDGYEDFKFDLEKLDDALRYSAKMVSGKYETKKSPKN